MVVESDSNFWCRFHAVCLCVTPQCHIHHLARSDTHPAHGPWKRHLRGCFIFPFHSESSSYYLARSVRSFVCTKLFFINRSDTPALKLLYENAEWVLRPATRWKRWVRASRYWVLKQSCCWSCSFAVKRMKQRRNADVNPATVMRLLLKRFCFFLQAAGGHDLIIAAALNPVTF